MRMKNPAHPGEVVADALADLQDHESRRCQGARREPRALSRHPQRPGARHRRNGGQAQKGFGSTAATWLAMQAAYDLARVKPVKVARLDVDRDRSRHRS